jgi:Ferritin-like domain
VATTTTTAPPRQPDEADVAVLVFSQTLELALVAIYDAAITGGRLDPAHSALATLFRSHHLEHSQAIASAAGKSSKNLANKAVVRKFVSLVGAATDQNGVLLALFHAETAAAATYGQALGQLKATDSASTVASIYPVEQRHAAVLARAVGLNPADYLLPFDGDTKLALAPSSYAIEG